MKKDMVVALSYIYISATDKNRAEDVDLIKEVERQNLHLEACSIWTDNKPFFRTPPEWVKEAKSNAEAWKYHCNVH